MREGQKRRSERKFYPGYVLVQMEMDEQTWHLVRDVPKVLGFIGGTSDRPAPISEKEAMRILQRVEEGVDKPRPKVLFEPGQVVRVVHGPFNDFNGVVESVNYEKNRLHVAVQILGRSTPGGARFLAGREGLKGHEMAKKVQGYIKLQVPAGSGQSGAADRTCTRPAGREHHGVLQAVQCADRQAGEGTADSRDHHGVLGPQLHLHHEDPAGFGADSQGDWGLKKAVAPPIPPRSARSRAHSSKRSPSQKQPDLTAADLAAAVRTIAGSARSMGVDVEGL